MSTTPRWTIIPPLDRPISPRQRGTPWARVERTDRTSWRMAAAPAKAASPKATSAPKPRMPDATQATTVSVPAQAGHSRRRWSTSVDARRHGSAGATAIRNSRVKPIGIVIRSK